METTEKEEEVLARVMKLVDVREETPPPPPPPPRERPPEVFQNTVEAVAETMVETDEVPDEVISDIVPDVEEEQIEFLPMHKVSELPKFSDAQILDALVYPPIALRSGIEGFVYLELFVDRQGEIRQIRILKETPEGRGFGEAAVNAFKGIQATTPGKSNDQDVAVRLRRPVQFKLK
jgi:protein TonB